MLTDTKAQGPLRGVKVLEFVGLGPAPFCAMLLSDLGAEVVRIDRPHAGGGGPAEVLARGRRSAAFNLKSPGAVKACLSMMKSAHIVLEGYRPGVMERLGLGPEEALKANPALVYGRMTGWGQYGPLAHAAGHDLNYIALTGVLDAIGPKDKPVPPVNVVGDFGGGSMYLAVGVLAALHHARTTGEGQVVDAAIVDGAAHLMGAVHQLDAIGMWSQPRGENLLDGGAPFYDAYRCADDAFVSIGALEGEFFQLLIDKLGLSDHPAMQAQYDAKSWPAMRQTFEETFASQPQAHWIDLLDGTDACFAPVLDTKAAAENPHMKARGVFVEVEGVRQAAPAPRFSRTPGAIQSVAPVPGEHTETVLRDWGFSDAEIASLKNDGGLG
ncbi:MULTISPECIES: CaiB/BaiF CoA-transferase family protein [unclassified Oceanicaulis]|uniref:CaiB/BaiF CoA transferase family protein n=1 Tax=unclassified Oceanicaulis TaxID=2632123 RepID=UPI0025E2BA96|nr:MULTISPECIES: CaiB/BaiF CoA-transferase family protein [unclassified Oceanicaulis]|tara:strand:- start:2037 stop:3185 length:1149 start_codon:yes stop_codon:yes gene_type:complete